MTINFVFFWDFANLEQDDLHSGRGWVVDDVRNKIIFISVWGNVLAGIIAVLHWGYSVMVAYLYSQDLAHLLSARV